MAKKGKKAEKEQLFTLYFVDKKILHSIDVFSEIRQYPRVLFKEQIWLNTPPRGPVFKP